MFDTADLPRAGRIPEKLQKITNSYNRVITIAFLLVLVYNKDTEGGVKMTTIEYLARELTRVEADIKSARACGDATMDAFYQGVQYALRSVWTEGFELPSKEEVSSSGYVIDVPDLEAVSTH